ncbi:hypothetical protein T08_16668 [Trichinella sp. T8]|nr:hypothetical protein T08_16668 [Trichinella sp. T8]
MEIFKVHKNRNLINTKIFVCEIEFAKENEKFQKTNYNSPSTRLLDQIALFEELICSNCVDWLCENQISTPVKEKNCMHALRDICSPLELDIQQGIGFFSYLKNAINSFDNQSSKIDTESLPYKT